MDWTKEQLEAVPFEDGFYLRGNDMTRIETFVAAAFAFCITLIMIAGGSIPTDIPQAKKAMLTIPAFLFAAAQLIWIWSAHARWSKRYGLEDSRTVMLSGLLIMLVLVYVYPMRMMASGMFAWLSNGFFDANLLLTSYDDLRFLFYFGATGFTLLSLLFYLLYRHAFSLRERLMLNDHESQATVKEGRAWLVVFATSIVVLMLTATLPDYWVSFAPMLYGSLWFTLPLSRKHL